MQDEPIGPHRVPAESPASGPHRGHWFAFLMGTGLVYAIWALRVGWDHTLLDVHGFRQAETAITVTYLLKGSPWLRYEMPVFGAPWSIPFEFPLYQWIVAGVVWLLDTPIVETGRFVGAAFFLLTMFPIVSLQTTLGIRGRERYLLPALLLMSPLYLFWSRTFLIESTALFFSAVSVAAGAKWLVDGGRPSALLVVASVSAVVGALVKVTTFVGFLAALAAVALLTRRRHQRQDWSGRRVGLGVVLLAALPLTAALAWTRFADGVKRENALADGVYTSDALRNWVFGTVTQKLDMVEWVHHLARTIRYTIGHPGLLVASLLLALLIPGGYRRAYLVCLGLFVLVPAVFTNLHFVHEYYPYASGLFLSGGIAVCVLGALRAGPPVRIAGVALLVLTLAASVQEYLSVFHRLQSRNRQPDRQLIERVHRVAAPNDVVMIYGGEANPELPFYLERRAVMDWLDRDLESQPWIRALDRLKRDGFRVGAFLACLNTRQDSTQIRKALSALGFGPERLYSGAACDLYAGPA